MCHSEDHSWNDRVVEEVTPQFVRLASRSMKCGLLSGFAPKLPIVNGALKPKLEEDHPGLAGVLIRCVLLSVQPAQETEGPNRSLVLLVFTRLPHRSSDVNAKTTHMRATLSGSLQHLKLTLEESGNRAAEQGTSSRRMIFYAETSF
jgi:hypothetical protein